MDIYDGFGGGDSFHIDGHMDSGHSFGQQTYDFFHDIFFHPSTPMPTDHVVDTHINLPDLWQTKEVLALLCTSAYRPPVA